MLVNQEMLSSNRQEQGVYVESNDNDSQLQRDATPLNQYINEHEGLVNNQPRKVNKINIQVL